LGHITGKIKALGTVNNQKVLLLESGEVLYNNSGFNYLSIGSTITRKISEIVPKGNTMLMEYVSSSGKKVLP
jgi:hypothetical protein